ncbi:phage baseplate assembly protein V [Martelella alba]|uniref:Phage baseplate assembly protein V n=1 Tax=Martelella alba TaxID=2590451 RepID=A0ABY2SR28_9HYPH|nr:phage baseplate assembly protein V [Martelella alba]TKI08669.1 phage baseplate assembly protein V [Martelella alba]
MWDQIDSRIRAALRGIRFAFRGRLTRVNSALKIQQVQLNGFAGEQLQDAEMFQHFGFTSCPPAGTQCIILPLGGQTSHSIIIATENDTLRIAQLASGETAIYSAEGAYVAIKKGRVVDVDCDEYHVKCKKYTVESEDYNVAATNGAEFDTPLLKGTQEIADGKSTIDEIRAIYDEHTHHHDDPAGVTDPPNQQM